jgi:hypothetical protein
MTEWQAHYGASTENELVSAADESWTRLFDPSSSQIQDGFQRAADLLKRYWADVSELPTGPADGNGSNVLALSR